MPSAVTWKTELALGSSPLLAVSAQSYTDVSAYVREESGASLTRGRSDENSTIQPSTFTITFDNSDGRFTPGNILSPYVSTLDMGTMIRRTAIIDAISYVRFVGYVDEIDIPEWANAPFDKVAVFSCSDRLARIGGERSGTMLSQVDYATLAALPALYWSLGDASGSTFGAALTTVETDPLLKANEGVGEVAFGSSTVVSTDTRSSVGFTSPVSSTGFITGANSYLKCTVRTPINYGGTAKFALSAWATPEEIFAGSVEPTVIKIKGSSFWASIYIESTTGRWMGKIANIPETLTGVVIGPVAAVGGPSFVALSCTSGTTIKMWINGVEYAGTTCPALTTTATTVTVGEPFTGSVASAAVYRAALTLAPVALMYQAGITGTRGLLSHDAMTLLGGYAGLLSGDLVCSPRGATTVDNIPTFGRSRAEVLQEIADIEAGILFADHNGILQFHTRPKRWSAGVPAYTFPIGDIVDTFAVSYNDAFIVNESTVTRTNGVTARAVDAASQTKRGIYASSEDRRFGTDNEAPSRARYRVATYKDPKARLGAFPVRVTTSLAPQSLMPLTVGTLVALTGLSTDAPVFGTQWIEGLSETQTIGDYTITYATSPIMPTSTVNYFKVGGLINAAAIIAP